MINTAANYNAEKKATRWASLSWGSESWALLMDKVCIPRRAFSTHLAWLNLVFVVDSIDMAVLRYSKPPSVGITELWVVCTSRAPRTACWRLDFGGTFFCFLTRLTTGMTRWPGTATRCWGHNFCLRLIFLFNFIRNGKVALSLCNRKTQQRCTMRLATAEAASQDHLQIHWPGGPMRDPVLQLHPDFLPTGVGCSIGERNKDSMTLYVYRGRTKAWVTSYCMSCLSDD